MEEQNRDELERFIRKQLSDDGPADNRWNVPPDQIFDAAMEALLPRKRRRGIWVLLLFPLLFGIGVVGYYGWQTNQKIEQLHAELDQLKKEQKNKQTSNSFSHIAGNQTEVDKSDLSKPLVEEKEPNADQKIAIIPPTNNSTQSSSEKGTSSSENFKEDSKRAKANQKTNSHQNGNQELNTKHEKIRQLKVQLNAPRIQSRKTAVDVVESNSINKIVDISIVTSSKDIEVTSNEKTSKSSLVEKLITPSLYALEYQNTRTDDLILYPIINSIGKKKYKSTLRLNLFGGLNLSSLQIKSDKNAAFDITGYGDTYRGFDFGIGVDYQFHKHWAIQAGVTCSHYKNKSQFIEPLVYDVSNETTTTGGDVEYRQAMTMESPLNTMEAEAIFTVADGQILDQEIMKIRTAFDISINTVGISLGGAYLTPSLGRFQGIVGAGLAGQYITSAKEKMEVKLYHNELKLMHKDIEQQVASEINPFLYLPYITVGIHYQLNQKIAIGLDGRYSRSINSMRKTPNPDDTSTYLRSLNLSLSVEYTF